jgi:hypothetical protein
VAGRILPCASFHLLMQGLAARLASMVFLTDFVGDVFPVIDNCSSAVENFAEVKVCLESFHHSMKWC